MSQPVTLKPFEHAIFGTNGGWGETIIAVQNQHQTEPARVRVDVVGGDAVRSTAGAIFGSDYYQRRIFEVSPYERNEVMVKYAGSLAEVTNLGDQPFEVWTDQ